MARGATKTKARAEAPLRVQEQQLAEDMTAERKRTLVDELGKLLKKHIAAKAVESRWSKLRKALLELVGTGIAGETVITVLGAEYAVQFTPCANSRKVTDMAAAKRILGKARYEQLVQLAIGDLEKYMTPDEIKQCVTESRTGSRECSVVRVEDMDPAADRGKVVDVR